MSDTTSPPSVHLHPLSPSSSMSSTDSAPQSEPTSDEQPDLGAFTTVLRAWTHLQPPPRIPVQIYSPTTSTTTTFQPDQSVADSDHDLQTVPPPPTYSSSFTRPPSSSLVQEESTVWNHAPIASYLYSATPSLDRDEDENSLASTEGGRTVEINSELSFDDLMSSIPSHLTYLDVAVPVPLEPSLLLPPSGSPSSSVLRTISVPQSNSVSFYSSTLSLVSYQITETPPISEDHDLLMMTQRTAGPTASLKPQRPSNSYSMATPQQQQQQTVLIHPPPQTISDDASVSHLSLPPSDTPPISTTKLHPSSHPYLPQQQLPTSLSQSRLPTLCIESSASTTSLARGISGRGQGTVVVDDLTPDQTPDSCLVDWKRGGRFGGFRPVVDDDEEVGERKSRAYGFGFGFGRAQQTQVRGLGQKHVSGYTSNYGM